VFGGTVHWSRVDVPLLAVALMLLGIGLLFVGAMADVDVRYDRDGIRFEAHLKKLAVTLPLIALGMLVRPRWLRKNAWAFYVGALVLLALVPVLGEERNNARRWIPTPVFDLQPSEVAKLALILVLARALYRRRLKRVSEWTLPVALALVPMVVVAAQPDLGTAMTIVPVTLGMLYLAGADGRVLSAVVAGVAVLGLSAWKLEWVQEYQLRRIDTWAASFDPEHLREDKNGDAFHVYHAQVAIGNGGWLGTGLGRGIANQAGHLPERESDSIFAVIAEEGGFFGAGALIVLYALLVVLILADAGHIRERFSRLVVGGIGLYFASHFLVNAGVNLGLLPMTGLTLPLLSTGGSSLLVTFLSLGLALGLSANAEPSLDEDAFRS
jgi:rod shape determining protein RodA